MTRFSGGPNHIPARSLVVVAMLALTLSVAGCGARQSETSATTPATPAAAPASESAGAPVSRMGIEDARSAIGTSFPAEVPVAAGRVVQGKAQGPDAWDYELEVASTPEAVAAWYLSEYQRRSWELVDQQVADGAIVLQLRKGGAESQIIVKKSQTGDTANVRALLGLATPVLETQ